MQAWRGAQSAADRVPTGGPGLPRDAVGKAPLPDGRPEIAAARRGGTAQNTARGPGA